MKIFQRVSELLSEQVCILKFTKGHYYMKTVGGISLSFSAYFLIMLYIVPSFKKISPRVSELLSKHDLHTEIYKGL